MTELVVLWRWREVLVPKVLLGLYAGVTVEQATADAIKAGRYSASRIYEVSVDGGNTWISAPKDMPVIDINGAQIVDDRRRSGKPSNAAMAEMDRLMREAEAGNSDELASDAKAWENTVRSTNPPPKRTRG